jgi:hypothetical protein
MEQGREERSRQRVFPRTPGQRTDRIYSSLDYVKGAEVVFVTSSAEDVRNLKIDPNALYELEEEI